MSQIVGMLAPLGFARGGTSRQDDDLVDRMSHSHTVLILVIFSIVVSTKQYVGDPIQCWSPAYFSSNYMDYTNKVCWVSNTYHLPFEDPVKTVGEPRRHLVYYQWVPMILLLQAVLFYLPCVLWRALNSRTGVDINSLVEASNSVHQTDNRDKTIRYIIRSLDRYLGSFRNHHNGANRSCCSRCYSKCCGCGPMNGNYLTLLYIFIKLVYVSNAIAQLFLLDAFLGAEYHGYGFEVIQGLIAGNDWAASRRFPRVTMCDFRVRQLGNVQHYTVQCVLPINLFNEKIFFFLWVWLVLLTGVSALSVLVWVWRALTGLSQTRFIRRHLQFRDKLHRSEDRKTLARFVRHYLRTDGVFVLRLISLNSNNLTSSEIIAELWEVYKNNPSCWSRRPVKEEDLPDV